MHIYWQLYNVFQHKKRRLLGDKRIELVEKLTKEQWSASFNHKMEANEMMNYGEKEPSHLPTTNTL